MQAEIAAAERGEKAALKAKLAEPKKVYIDARKKLITAIRARTKQIAKAVKELKKLQEEREGREQEINLAAEREITHLNEAAADLRRICSDPDEAQRYFAVVNKPRSRRTSSTSICRAMWILLSRRKWCR